MAPGHEFIVSLLFAPCSLPLAIYYILPITAGPKIKTPTTNETMAVTKTAPAAISLITFISGWIPGCWKSAMRSMALFNASAASTDPIHKSTRQSSAMEIFSQIPVINTKAAATNSIRALRSVRNNKASPAMAFLVLLSHFLMLVL